MTRRSNPRGFALLWALFLVILVGSMTTVVLTRDLAVRRDGARDLEALKAFHAAEAGIERAKHEFAKGVEARRSWSGVEFDVGACRVKVRVKRRDDGGAEVASEASPGGARIEAVLAWGATPREPFLRRWKQVR